MEQGDDDLVLGVSLKPSASAAPGPSAAPPTPAEPTWFEREERDRLERARRDEDDRAANERRTDAAIARMRALASDNGSGFCAVCGVKFTLDDENRAMHPPNECAGPRPPNCLTCGREPELRTRGGFKTWELVCGPSDHAAALGQQNPASDITIQRPRRIGRDDEDDDS